MGFHVTEPRIEPLASRAPPNTWRNPSATEPAVVLWLAVPNPYAQL